MATIVGNGMEITLGYVSAQRVRGNISRDGFEQAGVRPGDIEVYITLATPFDTKCLFGMTKDNALRLAELIQSAIQDCERTQRGEPCESNS